MFVYKIVKNGKTFYIGITEDLLRRGAQHGEKLEAIVGGLTRLEARGVEQALIEIHGLAKNGGELLNKINSIAKTNPIYKKAVEFGKKTIEAIGYRP